MTIASTRPISLSAIQTEFGGSNPISMSEYYRGGTLVPSGTSAGTTGVQIATSGAINMDDFRGTIVGVPIANFSGNIYAMDFSTPYSETATLVLRSDGVITKTTAPTNGGSYGLLYWYTPTTVNIGTGVWVYVSNAGPNILNSGTLNTWIELSSNRSWVLSASGTAYKEAALTFQFAYSSGGPTVVSRTMSMYVEAGV